MNLTFEQGESSVRKLYVIVVAVAALGLAAFPIRRMLASGPPFSNGTLNGTYVFSVSGGGPSSGCASGCAGGFDATGTLEFDGNGSVSGTITEFLVPSVGSFFTCPANITPGSYSVDSTGALQLALTFNPAGSGCGPEVRTITRHFAGMTVQHGHAFVFAQDDSDQDSYSSGTAIAQ
jgi:hypothetical protein